MEKLSVKSIIESYLGSILYGLFMVLVGALVGWLYYVSWPWVGVVLVGLITVVCLSIIRLCWVTPSSATEEHQTLKHTSLYVAVVVLIVLIIGLFAFNYYVRLYAGRLQDPLVNVMTEWGGVKYKPNGDPDMVLTKVDGRRLLSFQLDHRVAVVGFSYDGPLDLQGNLLVNSLDVSNLQKSVLCEIINGEMRIIFSFDDKFVEEWKNKKGGTWYTLFLIPRKIEMEYFSTIRQALAFGAIPLQTSRGPP